MLKFQIENFGKVRRADISLSPFLMLVGKNNTGKSYIASLIWAFSNLASLLSAEDSPEHPKWFAELAHSKRSSETIEIDRNKAEEIIKHLNKCFEINGSSFLSDLFAYNSFSDTKVRVLENDKFENFLISILPVESLNEKNRPITSYTIGADQSDPWIKVRYPSIAGLLGKWFINRLYTDLVGTIIFGRDWVSFRSPLYIPAARTGLMLAVRALVSQSFDPEVDEQPQKLPKPLASFLQSVTNSGGVHDIANSAPAEWLSGQIVHGSIQSDDAQVPSFSYVPDQTAMSVPLHAASSMITELAPFLVMSRNKYGMRHIIFEEPEAHLHLEAQRSMARTIARLLNEGVNITVTTHSDTFVQQINNLMRLHGHPKQKELMQQLGYEQIDLIDPAKASAYEFAPSPEGTDVKKLEITSQGFEVPSLNETLLSLAEETVLISEDEDD